jgi:7-cyano-7-deazaguanine synthase
MGKAVVLLSGGLDSSTTMAIAKDEGYEVYALTFNYGQRHRREVRAARVVGKALGAADHKVMKVDLNQIGGSALTSAEMEVPVGRSLQEIGVGIPSTYVPARNTILLSFALAWAEVVDADALFIGANFLDHSGYPDCRPEYFQAFQRMANLATKRAVEGKPLVVKTPLIQMTKAQIVLKAKALGVPLEKTWSCYLGGARACGRCDSCILRLKGFREAGVDDPLEYEARPR